MNSHRKTQEYIKGKSPLFIFLKKENKMIHTYMYLAFGDLSILFLKVSAVACNATLTLLYIPHSLGMPVVLPTYRLPCTGLETQDRLKKKKLKKKKREKKK